MITIAIAFMWHSSAKIFKTSGLVVALLTSCMFRLCWSSIPVQDVIWDEPPGPMPTALEID